MSELIDRQQALKALRKCQTYLYDARDPELKIELSSAEAAINNLSTIQPEKAQLFKEGTTSDLISKFIDGLEEIFADLRERHVDDSVCGLCEYDGAYIGQSGDWCNECPGFDRDDCFKLSDKTRKKWTEEIIKALPPVQPEQCGDKSYTLWKESYEELKRRMDELTSCSDIISRQAAIDIERNATVDTNPSHFEAHQKFTQFMDDAEISSFGRWQWSNGFNTALTAVGIDLKKLPPVQPEPKEGHWIEGGIYRDIIECYCSECGQLMTTAASVRMNYCPRCGADMRGEQHG